ncbi:MAG: TerB family tellurite resistance protein [Nannocystaceae bacterium]
MATLTDPGGEALKALLGVVAADSSRPRQRASLDTYERLTGAAIDEGVLDRGREHARAQPGAWLSAARALARTLAPAAPEQLLGAAFEIATADGFVLDEEDRVLSTLAAALGMSEAEYRHSVERMLAAAQS